MGYLILKLASRCMLSAVIHTQLSYPAMLLAEQLEHHWLVHSGPLTNPIKRGNRSPQPTHIIGPAPTKDRDQIVSRPFYKIGQTQLTYHCIGEQPNPWDLLQPQDVMSQHQGAKPPRRCKLLVEKSLIFSTHLLISLFSNYVSPVT